MQPTMSTPPPTSSRLRSAVAAACLALGAVAALALALSAGPAAPERVHAIAPCVQRPNTAPELELLRLVEQFKGQPFTLSAPLNAAALGYAEFLVSTGGTGHYADGSDMWERALNCGYPLPVGGEALARNVGTPQQALQVMISIPGSGINVPGASCAGVGYASGGARSAWVVLLFASRGGCPSPVTATASPSASASPSPSATASRSATPSPTAVPTVRATANFGVTVTILPGWNLVTLPAGPIDDVLDMARGCYSAVYQLGPAGGWRVYSPDVPAYARTLQSTQGIPVWILGTASCTDIRL